MRNRGMALLETVTAAAIVAAVTLSLAAGLTTAIQVAATADAVTRGRLLAQAHLELTLAGEEMATREEGGLKSRLTVFDADEGIVYQVEITGDGLPRPLRLAGRR